MKKFLKWLLIGVFFATLIGGVAFLSKGFTNFDYKTWFVKEEIQSSEQSDDTPPISNSDDEDESNEGENEDNPPSPSTPTRQSVKEINLISETSNTTALTDEKLLLAINGDLETPIFTSIEENSNIKVFVNGQDGLKFGTASVNGGFNAICDDYSFNHLKLSAKPFSESALIKVCGVEKAIMTDSQTYEFEFEETQSSLSIIGQQSRFYISSIEMWTE